MAERGLSVDHTTVWRWTQIYAPEVQRRLRGQLTPKGSTWHMDETFVRIAGRWTYLFRAVDSGGQTVDFYLSETRDREAAKCFLRRALANPDNRPPHVFARDRLRSYPAAIRALQNEGHLTRRCRHRTRRYANNRIESDHRHVKRRLRAMQGPRTILTASALIAGIEAVQIIRKGQVLGITRKNLHGQAWSLALCSDSSNAIDKRLRNTSPLHLSLLQHSPRGLTLPAADNARRRNSLAAVRSRLGDSMKSMVSPAESTAR
jgi:transposase, IS6 family